MTSIRPPAVAGLFYPATARELAGEVDALLAAATPAPLTSRLVISPHAGYIYSGALAAQAIACLPQTTRRVLVLGPTHRVGIAGMALAGADAHATPLGVIPTDAELSAELTDLPQVVTAPIVQQEEHSLEVQLPFLQRHLESDFTVVPLAVGQVDASAVAAVIECAWDHADTAIVISSDLSHYLPYDQAGRVDGATLHQLLTLRGALVGEQACGAYPVSGAMEFARRMRLAPRLLAACNSGDTAGDRHRVVGYAALAFQDASLLPTLAYNAIATQLDLPPREEFATAEDLDAPGATFVTLTQAGQLRGCIGTLSAHRSLRRDVVANARAAAFSDPRFAPLTAAELAEVDIEVSLLSAPTPLASTPGLSLTEVASALRPGIDGVIISDHHRHATFLPQVWEQLPEASEFLRHLLAKGGWGANGWHEGIRVETYHVTPHHLAADQ
ncbi:MAG: AmmeMemoRadiSam system protein B [Bowdeniella nasicola]|nr:AmmeMemoRadiSam system protein B [Bowdeniella nasicola]